MNNTLLPTSQDMGQPLNVFMKQKDEQGFHGEKLASLGYFAMLPTEVLHEIYSYLSVEEISKLTITSKEICDSVWYYSCTYKGLLHLTKTDLTQKNAYKQRFIKLGIFIKRSTCLHSTMKRIKICLDFFAKLETVLKNKKVHICEILTCFGIYMQTFFLGWQENECLVAYANTEKFNCYNIKNILANVLTKKTGCEPKNEILVRFYYRSLFYDHCSTDDEKSFWLTTLLESLSLKNKAKFLHILFGPLYNGQLRWCYPGYGIESNSFTEMAVALRMLMEKNPDVWTDTIILSIIKTSTDIPCKWTSAKTAKLLVEYGDAIACKYLLFLVHRKGISQTAQIIVHLAINNTVKTWGADWVVTTTKLVSESCENEDRRIFLSMIPVYFNQLYRDALNTRNPVAAMNVRLEDVITAQNSFLANVLLTAFNPSPVGREE